MYPKRGILKVNTMKVGVIVSSIFWAVIAVYLSACSFKLEMGYHGQTGRDDRVQTQLVGTETKKVKY